MLIRLDSGNMALWLIIGAVVGIALGLLAALAEMRRRKRAFGETGELVSDHRRAASEFSESESSESDLKRAA
jgi:hypothetical protein